MWITDGSALGSLPEVLILILTLILILMKGPYANLDPDIFPDSDPDPDPDPNPYLGLRS